MVRDNFTCKISVCSVIRDNFLFCCSNLLRTMSLAVPEVLLNLRRQILVAYLRIYIFTWLMKNRKVERIRAVIYDVTYDGTSNGKAFDIKTLYLSVIIIGMMQAEMIFEILLKADSVFDISKTHGYSFLSNYAKNKIPCISMIIFSELVGRHCNLLFTSKADRETHKNWNDIFNGQRERIARAEEINHHVMVAD